MTNPPAHPTNNNADAMSARWKIIRVPYEMGLAVVRDNGFGLSSIMPSENHSQLAQWSTKNSWPDCAWRRIAPPPGITTGDLRMLEQLRVKRRNWINSYALVPSR